jgi:hypothetical protein
VFKLKKLNIPNGKRPVFLLIENDRIPFEEFEHEINNNGNYNEQLDRIYTWIQRRSCEEQIPQSKFKALKGRKKSDKIIDFEYKTENLRVYSFAFGGGEVIWSGEVKNPKRQEQTIERMRGIKKRFYDQSNITIIEEEERND